MKNKNLGLPLLIAGVLLLFFTCVSAYLVSHIPWIWRITGILAVITWIAYFVFEMPRFKELFSKRTTQYGLNSVVMSFFAFLIVILLNYVFSMYDKKFDLTKNKLHTLSDQSQKVLKNLKHEVVFKVFVSPQQIADFDHVLDKYTYLSPMVKKQYVDVDKEPGSVQKYNIKQPGTIVIESQNRSARVDNVFGPEDPKIEEKLTNAIISVSKGEKKKIYFVTGHGEKMYTDTGREGYSEMKDDLEGSRYKLEEIILADKEKIPADAEIVICAGPKSDFLDNDFKVIDEYLSRGGKFMLMMEPISAPNMKNFLAKYGVAWNPKKTVLETNRLQQLAGGNPLTPIVTSYSSISEITKETKQMSIFPIPTPVERMANVPNGYKVESLFSTSPKSLEVDFQEKITVDENKARKGPFSLALSITGKAPNAPKAEAAPPTEKDKKPEPPKDPEFRFIVVGDADFASNAVRRFGINADLFQNMLSWLAKEEDLISIRPRPADASEFEITEERFRIIHFASIWFLPPMMLISGIVMWFTRKRK